MLKTGKFNICCHVKLMLLKMRNINLCYNLQSNKLGKFLLFIWWMQYFARNTLLSHLFIPMFIASYMSESILRRSSHLVTTNEQQEIGRSPGPQRLNVSSNIN